MADSMGFDATPFARRMALIRHGYTPVPITDPDDPTPGLNSPGKQPKINNWQHLVAETLTEGMVRSWCEPGTGILTRTARGIDIDVLDPELSARLGSLTVEMLGPTPLIRVGRAPKTLFVYRSADQGAKLLTSKMMLRDGTEAQVEMLGAGQQFVAFGIHPFTRQSYAWEAESPLTVPLADLPAVTQRQLIALRDAAEAMMLEAGAAPLKALKENKGGAKPERMPRSPGLVLPGDDYPQPTVDEVADALRAVPNDCDWSGWVAMGGSIFDALADDGEDLFLDWSGQHAKHDDDAARRKWASFKTSPSVMTKAYLFRCARDNGWKPEREKDRETNGERRHAVANAPNDGWPAPIDFLGDAELTGAPVLRVDHLPDALAGFVFDTAKRMGVEPASVALSAIVAVASVANDDWQIQPKVHDTTWTEQPRLWGAIIGPPSILKSPVLRATTAPIDALEARAREVHAEAMQKWRQQVAAMKQDKVPPPYPPQPRCDRYLAESSTTEAISEILRDDDEAKYRTPARKLMVRQDELSEWLAGLDQYRSGGRGGADRGSYLRLFNGGRFTVDRIGRGSFAIANWSASILGGIQPEPIQRIAKDAADDGLLQRFLFIVPSAQHDGEDVVPDAEAIRRYYALFPALSVLGPPREEARTDNLRPKPIAVTLSTGAHPHRERVNAVAKSQASLPDVSPRLQAAFGKWPGIFARLALTFHLIDIADAHARAVQPPFMGVLPEETAQRAAAFMLDILLPHLLRAEAVLYSTAQTGHAHWIAGYILASRDAASTGKVTARDIQRAYRPLKAPEQRRELVSVMSSLEVMGWLRADWPDNPAIPVTTWHVNPALHETFAERAASERARRDASKAEAISRATSGRAAA
jgi:hypothetical protein